MTPAERAERAQKILSDEVFEDVMADIRLGLVARLEASAMGDVETHHEVALSLQVLKSIREQLARYTHENAVIAAKLRDEQFRAAQRKTLRV